MDDESFILKSNVAGPIRRNHFVTAIITFMFFFCAAIVVLERVKGLLFLLFFLAKAELCDYSKLGKWQIPSFASNPLSL